MKNPEKITGQVESETKKNESKNPYNYDASKIIVESAKASLHAKEMLLNDLAFTEIAEDERGVDILQIHPNSNPAETIYFTANGHEIDEISDLVKNKKMGDAVSKK